MYIVAADGACRGNQSRENIGAWAYAIWNQEDKCWLEHSKVEYNTTNNFCEISAFLGALNSILLNNLNEVKILLDSSYVLNSINLGWVYNWEKVNYKYNKDPSGYRPNMELWKLTLKTLREIESKGIKITLEKIKGHADNKYNIYVDKLCNDAMDGVKK